MADEELEVLRNQRLAELQAKHKDPIDAAQQEAKHREAEMRNSILAQVLDQSARASDVPNGSSLAQEDISLLSNKTSSLNLSEEPEGRGDDSDSQRSRVTPSSAP